jgi:glycosyltransferase involved in cell wall biosynthesis
MKLLHVTPHLGGGVGKAHAALSAALPKEAVDQTFLLLEEPRDRRYADLIEARGVSVITADSYDHVRRLASEADIVQFEFWNHPRLLECLARTEFPAMRSVFWSHISGLSKPLIQPGLMEEAGRFVFTSEASRSLPAISQLSEAARKKITVINSGFGFPDGMRRVRSKKEKPVIAYLGTVDFVKMHSAFFDIIDDLVGDDIRALVWGPVEPSGPVLARARAMRHPERIKFCGETADPAVALSEADIFFYPLRSDHYGTAENALIEAMSLGLTPVVMNNPAEMVIVRDCETGFVARSTQECVSLLQMLLLLPDVRDKISRNAIRYVVETRTPAQSALDFMILWLGLLNEPAKHCNFRGIIGENPAEWFLAMQCTPGTVWKPPPRKARQTPSKGTLAHFEKVFAGDSSLARLRR